MADTQYNILPTIRLLLIREILEDSWYAWVSDFLAIWLIYWNRIMTLCPFFPSSSLPPFLPSFAVFLLLNNLVQRHRNINTDDNTIDIVLGWAV